MNRAQMMDAYVAKTGYQRTFAEQCKSGKGATATYLPGTTGLKDVRTNENQKLHIRCATPIALSGGRGTEAGGCFEYELPIKTKRVKVDIKRTGKQRRGIQKRQMAERSANLYSALNY